MRAFALSSSLMVIAVAPSFAGQDPTDLLRRQTQELMDAVTAGDPSPWQRYVDDRATYLSEDGTSITKRELVAQVKPLPKGVSGRIEIISFRAQLFGDTAVTTHEERETELYFGQTLHAGYRATDTWQKTSSGWKLIGSQMMALLNPPPTVELSERQLDEHVGLYQLVPEVRYQVRRQGKQLIGQRTGRSEQKLSAELPDVFFVPGELRSRKIFLRGADGRVTTMVDRREGQDVRWQKLP